MVGLRRGRQTCAVSDRRIVGALMDGDRGMWEPAGKSLDVNTLGSLKPTEILYEFSGEPLTFVALDPDAEPLLVHNLCVFDRTSRYLVAAIDTRILGELKA